LNNKERYKSVVFDFDGVILNSNSMKTDAYKYAIQNYGDDHINEFLCYHKRNGGISRYEKFKYFLLEIATENIPNLTIETLLSRFSCYIDKKIDSCELVDGLDAIRFQYQSAKWLIVSGSDQEELRAYAKRRKIDKYFDAGIYGSPDDKRNNIFKAINSGNIKFPAVLIGDSKLDHQVAKEFNLDFIFVSKWTDMSDWKDYSIRNNLFVIESLTNINLNKIFLEINSYS
jgi:phosphoglycolate phosphatase-like HAD superfamily hydrolase